MNGYFPILLALAFRQKAPELTNALLYSSPVIPPAPRMFLTYQGLKGQADDLRAKEDQRKKEISLVAKTLAKSFPKNKIGELQELNIFSKDDIDMILSKP